jgi:Gas vesicle protein
LKRVDFMTVAAQSRNRYLDRPAPSSLADVLDTILDKGLVIDIYVRVSLLGIELLTIDARIVIASVDTYLRFAEAVNRLAIAESDHKPGLTELARRRGRPAGLPRQDRRAYWDAINRGGHRESQTVNDGDGPRRATSNCVDRRDPASRGGPRGTA